MRPSGLLSRLLHTRENLEVNRKTHVLPPTLRGQAYDAGHMFDKSGFVSSCIAERVAWQGGRVRSSNFSTQWTPFVIKETNSY